MSDFYDAFQELKGLDEATFSFDKPGILALKKYINDDGEEETTTITVIDPAAETVNDMKDDYDGEVILKCSICGGLISKEPSQVKVDEQTQLANVEEECPYCYNVGGYEVIGEIHSPEENVDVDVTVNDDDTLEVDSDNVTVENKSMTEGLNEDVSVDKLAKFIENAVEGLKADKGTNYRYKFDDRFALFVGWTEGYDEEDPTVIHSEDDPEFVIAAGIKVWTSDDMWADFDWLNSPYLENGDVIDDSMTISPEEDYRRLAQDFLDDYNDDYKDLKVTKDGLVVEHDDEEEAPYRITYYYDDSFDYDNSDTETYATFAEVKDVFNSRRGDVFAIEVENNDGEVILSYSKDGTKNESISGSAINEDVSVDNDDYTDSFVDFLYSTEFELDKDEGGYYLVDLQGANLGSIDEDRFHSAEEIFDRMGVYIEDYFVRDLDDWAEHYKIELPSSYEEMLHFIDNNAEKYPLTDNEKYSYEVLDMVVNHYNDIDLEKALKSFNKKVNEGVEDWRSNVIDFPSGDYVYVGFEDGKLFAGSATNTGIMHEYEMEIDGDEFAEADYGLVVDNGRGTQELNQKLDTLAQAALQNQALTFSTIMKLFNSASLSEKQRLVEKGERELLERQQQAQQQQSQIAQQELEQKAQLEQAKMQQEDLLNQRDNNTKLMIARINTESKLLEMENEPKYSQEAKDRLLEQIREFDERIKLDRERLELDKYKNSQDIRLKEKQINKQSTSSKNVTNK